jgi:hypothetical protein
VLAAQILTGEVPLHNATGGATSFQPISKGEATLL